MKSKKYKLSAIVFYSVIIALALGLPNMAFASLCLTPGRRSPTPTPSVRTRTIRCNPHSYTDLGNGIVRDNVTGLEWQQATAPGTYTWQQAIDYVASMNSGSGTYGFTDWRLPTIKELSTLVDSSIPSSRPDYKHELFPGHGGGPLLVVYYPTPTILAARGSWTSSTAAWASTDKSSYYYYVRAVRGGQSSNSFVDNSDGTITDTSTGLMWQKATAPGTYTWEQALTYCENLTLPAGGYSDWRLPNRNELQSIVDYSRYNPAIDTTFFPGTVASANTGRLLPTRTILTPRGA